MPMKVSHVTVAPSIHSAALGASGIVIPPMSTAAYAMNGKIVYHSQSSVSGAYTVIRRALPATPKMCVTPATPRSVIQTNAPASRGHGATRINEMSSDELKWTTVGVLKVESPRFESDVRSIRVMSVTTTNIKPTSVAAAVAIMVKNPDQGAKYG